MNAQELSKHWNEVGTTVEGQFSAVRADLERPRLEVRIDFLGMGQVYYWTQGSRWLFSNSVELIARAIRSADLDPIGISLAISLGWVSGDRTLHDAVRVLPRAAHWRWEGTSNDPVKDCDYPANRFWSPLRTSRFGHSDAAQVGAKLAGICSELSKQQGTLECPITGGRDSRVLVGLMMLGQVSTQYYTDSFSGSEEDVDIGQEVARRFNLPYHVVYKDIQDLKLEWSNAVERLVRQNDGMVSLWQVADVLWPQKPESAPRVRVWGIGGEIGRGNYDNPKWHYGLKTAALAKRFLTRKLVEQSELITGESTIAAIKFLEKWVDQTLDDGCPVDDIPDLFYTFERVRRWAASNARKVRPWVDIFAPLCTRPFVEAAFGLAPSLRFCEPIHYELVRLNPKLHQIPFSSEPWRNQNPDLSMFKMLWDKKIRSRRTARKSPASYQAVLLEHNLEEVRDFCFAQGDSCVWNYIRRPQLESLLHKTASPQARQSQLTLLLQVITLLRYEQLLDETVSSDSPAIHSAGTDFQYDQANGLTVQ